MPMHKKDKRKKKAHPMRRNATPAAPLPRAIARPRRTTGDLVAAEIRKQDAEIEKTREDSRGWRLVNGVTGALLASAAGLVVEHQVSLPTAWITVGGLTGAGALAGMFAPNKALRSIGVGTAIAGTALLGTLADKQWFSHAETTNEHPHAAPNAGAATKPPTAAPKPGHANAADIPADALARAYERARLRMALTSEPTN